MCTRRAPTCRRNHFLKSTNNCESSLLMLISTRHYGSGMLCVSDSESVRNLIRPACLLVSIPLDLRRLLEESNTLAQLGRFPRWCSPHWASRAESPVWKSTCRRCCAKVQSRFKLETSIDFHQATSTWPSRCPMRCLRRTCSVHCGKQQERAWSSSNFSISTVDQG